MSLCDLYWWFSCARRVVRVFYAFYARVGRLSGSRPDNCNWAVEPINFGAGQSQKVFWPHFFRKTSILLKNPLAEEFVTCTVIKISIWRIYAVNISKSIILKLLSLTATLRRLFQHDTIQPLLANYETPCLASSTNIFFLMLQFLMQTSQENGTLLAMMRDSASSMTYCMTAALLKC